MFGDKHNSEVVRLMKDCDPELRPQVEAAQARLNELRAQIAMQSMDSSCLSARAGAFKRVMRQRLHEGVPQGWSVER